MEISTWIRGARLKTLPLAIAPVVIGAALSWRWRCFSTRRVAIYGMSRVRFFGGQHDLSECEMSAMRWSANASVSAGRGSSVVAVLCAVAWRLFLQVAANYRERLFRRHTWHRRGACRRFRTVICKNAIRGIDFDGPEIASGIAAPAWPRPSRRVRRESKESTCRGRNQRVDCLPVTGLAVVALTGYWWFIAGRYRPVSLAGWCYVSGEHPYGYHYLGEILRFSSFSGSFATLRHACIALSRHNHRDRRHGSVRRQRAACIVRRGPDA